MAKCEFDDVAKNLRDAVLVSEGTRDNDDVQKFHKVCKEFLSGVLDKVKKRAR